MAFKPITVNTPASSPAHILAEDDAAIYGGIIGGDCVLDLGNKLKATVITNNIVRVSDGVVVVGGHVGRLVKGDYEDMTITNGVSGQKRNDIIVARFLTTGPGGTDTYKLVVIKGASGTTATDPTIVKGDLYAGDKQRDYPLWRIKIEGLSIIKVEQMYEIAQTNKDLSDRIIELNGDLGYEYGSNANGHYKKYNDGRLEMWGNTHLTVALTKGNAQPYWSDDYAINFPVTSTQQCVVATDIAHNGVAWHSASSGSDYKANVKLRFYAPNVYNDLGVTVHWTARGRWK